MKNITGKNIALACHGIYHGSEEAGELEVSSITTDSRKVEKGCLFVPIVGEKVDPHKFIGDVMVAGALCTLSEEDLGEQPFPWIQVESTRQAVKDIAAFYLDQLEIPVVGVTGSVGKTSTKEAIASVLKEKYRTLKTPGNFNNELGLPLTVFSLTEEDEIAVLEMGINHFGEMTRLARVARPQTMVITNIGTAHVEFLGDRDGVLKAKTECLPFIREGGHLLLNGEDDKLRTVTGYGDIRPDFFGFGEDLACRATDLRPLGFNGTEATFTVFGESFEVRVPVPGRHMVANALAAAAVGKYYGLSKEEIIRGIASMQGMEGRFHLLEEKDLTIIDDCYNANPVSVKASLDLLLEGEVKGRRVAILGDMGELGVDEVALHQEVGDYAGERLDALVCVGELSKHMAEAAGKRMGDRVTYEPSLKSLLADLPILVRKGDTVLVKASHFMDFGKVVKALQELELS